MHHPTRAMDGMTMMTGELHLPHPSQTREKVMVMDGMLAILPNLEPRVRRRAEVVVVIEDPNEEAREAVIFETIVTLHPHLAAANQILLHRVLVAVAVEGEDPLPFRRQTITNLARPATDLREHVPLI